MAPSSRSLGDCLGDDDLGVAIAAVRAHPVGSAARRKALNRLLLLLQRLPGLYRSRHQDYPEAYNRTLLWVCENIDSFELRPDFGCSETLTRWVNGYLRWRVRDLYAPDSAYDRDKVDLNREDRDEDPIEAIPAPGSKLDLLEREIAEQQAARRDRFGQRVRDYLARDPDAKLRECHPRSHPQCNCWELGQRLLLAEPPERVRHIAREYAIPEQTLYSHWKKKCRPLIADLVRPLEPTS